MAKHKRKRIKNHKRRKRLTLIGLAFAITIAIVLASFIIAGPGSTARFFQPSIGIPPPAEPLPIFSCAGTPNGCSNYTTLNACVNIAGCTFVENRNATSCTNLTGPNPCSSYTNPLDCNAVGCQWIGLVEPIRDIT
jgi:hypothetical protein